MIFSRAALALVFALVGAPAFAQSQQKTVVELFTSQGCASCPPADALLSEIARDPRVIALTLPVDYWDYIGWKDTLALHDHSVRQRAYAKQRTDRRVFTPQVIVDGIHAVKGSDRAALQRALLTGTSVSSTLTVPVTLRQHGDSVEITVMASDVVPPEGAEIWVCPIVSHKTVTIGRGENSGRDMTYSNVVRGWIRVGHWNGTRQSFEIPLSDVKIEDADSVAVLLQSGTFAAPGPILGAAIQTLE